jgi:hypothetical protein
VLDAKWRKAEVGLGLAQSQKSAYVHMLLLTKIFLRRDRQPAKRVLRTLLLRQISSALTSLPSTIVGLCYLGHNLSNALKFAPSFQLSSGLNRNSHAWNSIYLCSSVYPKGVSPGSPLLVTQQAQSAALLRKVPKPANYFRESRSMRDLAAKNGMAITPISSIVYFFRLVKA